MTDQTNVVAVVDGPRIVRTRDGGKGPGKVAVVALTQADANAIATDLKADGIADVIITPYVAPTILSHEDWKKQTETLRATEKARKEALASLSPEIKALLRL